MTKQLGKCLPAIRKRLNQIHQSVPLQHVEDPDRAFRRAAELIRIAQREIRLFSFQKSEIPPEDYKEALVNRLSDTKGHAVVYEWVLAVQKRYEPYQITSLIDRCEQEVKRFAEAESAQRFFFSVLEVDERVGFDVMIVDRRHVLIYLHEPAPNPGHLHAIGAILIEDRPDFAKLYLDWFRDFIVPRAEIFRIWQERKRSEASQQAQEKIPSRPKSPATHRFHWHLPFSKGTSATPRRRPATTSPH